MTNMDKKYDKKSIFKYTESEFLNSKIIQRLVFGILMVTAFSFIIYSGPMGLMLFTALCNFQIYHEITDIGMRKFCLPEYSPYSYLILVIFYYWKFAEIFHSHFLFAFQLSGEDNLVEIFQFLQRYHLFITYTMYIATFVYFIWTLEREKIHQSLLLFSLFHLTADAIVTINKSAYFNINNGIFWYIVPAMLVTVNDVAAYVFGLNFGKTKLIKISPKKTVEGYLGAVVPTFLFGILFASFIMNFPRFYCPVTYNFETDIYNYECSDNELFIGTKHLMLGWFEYTYYPVYKHILVIACFISFIGPFGGFFSSAFKRTFDVKDYSDLIPGHGGFTDRLDCQIFVQVFVHVYYLTFIQDYKSMTSVTQLLHIKDSEKIKFFEYLTRNYLCQNIDKVSLLSILGNTQPSSCYNR